MRCPYCDTDNTQGKPACISCGRKMPVYGAPEGFLFDKETGFYRRQSEKGTILFDPVAGQYHTEAMPAVREEDLESWLVQTAAPIPPGFQLAEDSGLYYREEPDGIRWYDPLTGQYNLQQKPQRQAPLTAPPPPPIAKVRQTPALNALPDGFLWDQASGLAYRAQSAAVQNGQEIIAVTWFDPAAGEYAQVRYIAPIQEQLAPPQKSRSRAPAGIIAAALCLVLIGGLAWALIAGPLKGTIELPLGNRVDAQPEGTPPQSGTGGGSSADRPAGSGALGIDNIILEIDGKNVTAKLTGITVPGALEINQAATSEGAVEWNWSIMFSDGAEIYIVRSSHSKIPDGDAQTVTFDDLEPALWKRNSESRYNKVEGVAVSAGLSDGSVTWSFTLPDDLNMTQDAIQYLGYIHTSGIGELQRGSYGRDGSDWTYLGDDTLGNYLPYNGEPSEGDLPGPDAEVSDEASSGIQALDVENLLPESGAPLGELFQTLLAELRAKELLGRQSYQDRLFVSFETSVPQTLFFFDSAGFASNDDSLPLLAVETEVERLFGTAQISVAELKSMYKANLMIDTFSYAGGTEEATWVYAFHDDYILYFFIDSADDDLVGRFMIMSADTFQNYFMNNRME